MLQVSDRTSTETFMTHSAIPCTHALCVRFSSFAQIPHYKLRRATQAFRAAFPHLVRKSDQGVVRAFVEVSAGGPLPLLHVPSLPALLRRFVRRSRCSCMFLVVLTDREQVPRSAPAAAAG